MKIILNCDDLGMSMSVNEAIFELMDQGRVTSATLMANAPAFDDAVRRIGKYPDCSFGVHLNLTEFAPLSSHAGLGPLLNEQGDFAGIALINRRDFRWTAALRAGVYAEWSAQIERALAHGVAISHLDSHHHVHTQFGLLGVLKRVRQRSGIPRVRLRRNVGSWTQPMGMARRAANLAWNLTLRHVAGARTTDRFAAFSAFYDQLCCGVAWPGVIELMCHPGSERFAMETALLRGDWRGRMSREARLISYWDLG
jgi:predicted glycoside hydrolase/deacetylase ChbG (UPF0249 family)